MIDPAISASTSPANDPTPYGDLPEYARHLVDGIIMTFFEQAGWPSAMTHDQAKTTMVSMLQEGVVSIRPSRRAADQGRVFIIEITAAGQHMKDAEDEMGRIEGKNRQEQAKTGCSQQRNC